jgi:hypothetical protein
MKNVSRLPQKNPCITILFLVVHTVHRTIESRYSLNLALPRISGRIVKKTLVSKKRNFLFQYYCLQLYKIICQLQSFIKQYRCCLATTVSNGVRHLPPYGTRVLYPTDGRTVALLPPFQQSVGASSS